MRLRRLASHENWALVKFAIEDTSLLWIQQKIKEKDIEVDKVLGTENPADCLTKHVDRATMLKHLTAMGLEYESGRADSAPQLAPDHQPPQL